ncbi:MAG: RQC-minor-1 family DNA-binding protein [Woeseiaceae bacterium]|nr:RQC-minor-1 family DNA-binding protein [Woeseiaceae bacterium]
MARQSKKNRPANAELRRLLKRHDCPTALHAVRTTFLGSIASPKIETRPMQVVADLWGGELPEFETMEEANELLDVLVKGLWNDLARHQSRQHPFRLTPLKPPQDPATIRTFAQTRVEELEGFVNGLFGDEEAMDLPETAHIAVRNLGEVRSFFAAFVQFADDHKSPEEIEGDRRQDAAALRHRRQGDQQGRAELQTRAPRYTGCHARSGTRRALRTCRSMGRKVNRVPVHLDVGDVEPLPDEEIRTILRGADDLIMSGGRTLLARVLKGSKQKVIFEKELDQSPVYGAFHELSIDAITKRIDWMIKAGYLAIEYDYRLPLLVYTARGWAIEKEIYAAELLERLDQAIEQATDTGDVSWLSERHPEVLTLVANRIGQSGDPKYRPFLQRWKNKATRRMSRHIKQVINQLHD